MAVAGLGSPFGSCSKSTAAHGQASSRHSTHSRLRIECLDALFRAGRLLSGLLVRTVSQRARHVPQVIQAAHTAHVEQVAAGLQPPATAAPMKSCKSTRPTSTRKPLLSALYTTGAVNELCSAAVGLHAIAWRQPVPLLSISEPYPHN